MGIEYLLGVVTGILFGWILAANLRRRIKNENREAIMRAGTRRDRQAKAQEHFKNEMRLAMKQPNTLEPWPPAEG